MPNSAMGSFLLFLALLVVLGTLLSVSYRLWLSVKHSKMMICVPRSAFLLLLLLIDLNFGPDVFATVLLASLLLLLRLPC